MKTLFAATLFVAFSASAQTYYKDQQNNVIGGARTIGNTTYYTDQQNNVIGSSNNQGSSTYYTDQRNNVIGVSNSYNQPTNRYETPSYPAPIYNQQGGR